MTPPERPDHPDLAGDVTQYETIAAAAHTLFLRKNADYGGSWRQMSVAGFLDRMGVKIARAQNLLLAEQQVNDERLEDTLLDVVNEAILTLMRLQMPAPQIVSEADLLRAEITRLTEELAMLNAAEETVRGPSPLQVAPPTFVHASPPSGHHGRKEKPWRPKRGNSDYPLAHR